MLKNLTISKTLALSMFQASELAANVPDKTIEIFYLVASSIYGIRPDNVSTEMFQLAFIALKDRFKGITIEDVRLAYFNSVIVKKEFVSLTRDELLEPISDYWMKKENLKDQIKLAEIEKQKEIQIKQEEIEFRNKAKQCYINSLNMGEWQGDMFQAKVIARGFWDSLYLEDRKDLQERATEEIKSLQRQAKVNPLVIVYDKYFYLAQEVIKDSVKKGRKFID